MRLEHLIAWSLIGLAGWTAVASMLLWSLTLTVCAFVIFGAGMALLALADTPPEPVSIVMPLRLDLREDDRELGLAVRQYLDAATEDGVA